MRVSIDDGVTWVDVTGGVRVDIDLTGPEAGDPSLSATFNFTNEGVIVDLWEGEAGVNLCSLGIMNEDIPSFIQAAA